LKKRGGARSHEGKGFAAVFFILAGICAAVVVYGIASTAHVRDIPAFLLDALHVIDSGIIMFAVGSILWALGEIIDRLPEKNAIAEYQ
jgi:hypothetical protein